MGALVLGPHSFLPCFACEERGPRVTGRLGGASLATCWSRSWNKLTGLRNTFRFLRRRGLHAPFIFPWHFPWYGCSAASIEPCSSGLRFGSGIVESGPSAVMLFLSAFAVAPLLRSLLRCPGGRGVEPAVVDAFFTNLILHGSSSLRQVAFSALVVRKQAYTAQQLSAVPFPGLVLALDTAEHWRFWPLCPALRAPILRSWHIIGKDVPSALDTSWRLRGQTGPAHRTIVSMPSFELPASFAIEHGVRAAKTFLGCNVSYACHLLAQVALEGYA